MMCHPRRVFTPLIEEIKVAADIHGESLDGVVLPKPTVELENSRSRLIIDLIMSHPAKTITLVPTGA